jgi:hypothetical protein
MADVGQRSGVGVEKRGDTPKSGTKVDGNNH